MSSSAYAHQVPRLLTSSSATKLMATSMSNEHQNFEGRPPNNNNSIHHNQNNHERKWRVLVSIGLLLPALAAIIGIVAWTISIEVAHNEHQTTTSHNAPQRRVHEQQQQQQQQQQAAANQFRRDEALALAAMLTAKRQQWATAMATHSDNNKRAAAATPESELTGSPRLPVAAAVVKPRQAMMTQPTLRPTRSSSGKQQQQQHQMSKNDEQPALMLKNLDQVETLEEERNSSSADQEADSSESKSAARQLEAGDEITSPTSGRPVADEASSQAVNSAPDDDATAQDDEVIEQQQQQQQEQTMKQKSTGGAQLPLFEEQAAISKQPQEATTRGHKSRWHARRPIAMVSEPSVTKKSSKQQTVKKQQQEEAAKLNSKYTLVNNNNNSAKNDHEERGEQPDESTGEEVATSTSMSTAPASISTTTERPDCRDHVDATKTNDDDDVSFEAIASAISKTLSESQAQNNDHGEAGDSGDSTTSFVNDNSERQAQSEDEKPPVVQNDATMTKQRRRTTGEHLAEVIDHLVDRRKSGVRFGDRAVDQMSSYTQEGDSSPRQGPQIVVVAPVGPSGALLKARSLTKSSEPEVAKSTASGSLKKPVEAMKKAFVQLVKSSSSNATKSRAPLGARLLGVGPQLPVADSQLKQYSERVQVIEDDDSSALLMARPSPTGSGALAPTSGDHEYSSVHVSSHAGEPRLRTARHELSSRHFLERYAPMIVPQQQQRDSTIVRRTESPVAPAAAKLYSAEQLIRNHILKSKARSQSESGAARVQQQATGSQGASNVTSTTTTTTTTSAPPTSSAPSSSVNTSSTTAQPPTLPEQQNRQQQVYDAGMQSVQVPAFFMQQQFNPRSPIFQQQQLHHQDPYQVMESQQQQQQVQLPATGSGPQEYNEQRQAAAAALPTFADQEIQVPAHLADSVIRDLQQSASQVTGMLNGQPTLFQALPPALQHHQQQMAQVPLNYYQHQRNPMHQMQAESQQRPHFMMNNEQQQMAPNHLAYPFNSHFMSRAVAVARQQQQQEHNQRLANRDTLSAGKEESVQQRPVEEQQTRITPLKALTNPRSLVQPMAQMALKHLFTSLSQQAAAQQAQLEANEQHRRRHRSSPATISPADSKSSEASPSIQASGSSPVGVAALPPAASSSEPAAAARSMRSLPIGAQAPPSQQQVQLIQDQEAQESQGGYGGGPAYQMAHEPMHSYGGGHQQYSDDADKKSKGITFHFGGGPIGGGTQLITSPMGIFKHLMIPLMPNPRVNLNGKVVFGVVLEKSTAFGPPPKKKYKFWGR